MIIPASSACCLNVYYTDYLKTLSTNDNNSVSWNNAAIISLTKQKNFQNKLSGKGEAFDTVLSKLDWRQCCKEFFFNVDIINKYNTQYLPSPYKTILRYIDREKTQKSDENKNE